MKKKKLLAGTSLALVATVAIAGTVAYLTDTDSDTNVMTLGNVDIEQLEKERDEVGALTDFTQSKPLYPAYYKGTSIPWDDSANWVVPGEQAWKTVEKNENVIDKFVTVKNTGKSDAYVRTVFAFEKGVTKDGDLIHIVINATNVPDEIGDWYWLDDIVTIDGVEYEIAVATYKKALAPNETTIPSLKQVYLDKKATNEYCASLGDTYDILVVSQAVQAKGFEDATTALNEAFGEITATNHPWLDSSIVNVASSDELVKAIADADGPTTIIMADGNYTASQIKINKEKDITLVGSKNAKFDGQFFVLGKLTANGITITNENATTSGISKAANNAIYVQSEGKVECTNVTFDIKKGTGITSWWGTGDWHDVVVKNCVFNCNGNRPLQLEGPGTIDNCTFNEPYRYCVQLTANDAVINFTNNTINKTTNNGKPVYGVQLTSDYGNANLVINGGGNTINNTTGTDSILYVYEAGTGISGGFVDIDTIELNATDGVMTLI